MTEVQNTMTDDQKDEIVDIFFRLAENPCKELLVSTLRQLGVFVWGHYVANLDILDLNNEPSLSQRDLARWDEGEHTWLVDQVMDAIEEGFKPKHHAHTKDHDIKLYSSQLYPVEEGLLKTVEIIINTFDAFVMNDVVYNGAYFKESLPFAYDYQLAMVDEWEEQFLPEEEKEVIKAV